MVNKITYEVSPQGKMRNKKQLHEIKNHYFRKATAIYVSLKFMLS